MYIYFVYKLCEAGGIISILQKGKRSLQNCHWFVLGHTAHKCWRWGWKQDCLTHQLTLPLLCHTARFTTPNC